MSEVIPEMKLIYSPLPEDHMNLRQYNLWVPLSDG